MLPLGQHTREARETRRKRTTKSPKVTLENRCASFLAQEKELFRKKLVHNCKV